MILTSHHGNNSTLIKEVAELYITKDSVVADVTFGKGVFWNKISNPWFTLIPSDLNPREETTKKMDFCKMDYMDGSIDTVVFDPPYLHTPGIGIKGYLGNERYRTDLLNKMYYKDIINDLYFPGMLESYRVLKDTGKLWVKCKDQVESGKQCWAHFDLHNIGNTIGFKLKDLFVVTPSSRFPVNRWNTQIHARKNHSFLLIFEK